MRRVWLILAAVLGTLTPAVQADYASYSRSYEGAAALPSFVGPCSRGTTSVQLSVTPVVTPGEERIYYDETLTVTARNSGCPHGPTAYARVMDSMYGFPTYQASQTVRSTDGRTATATATIRVPYGRAGADRPAGLLSLLAAASDDFVPSFALNGRYYCNLATLAVAASYPAGTAVVQPVADIGHGNPFAFPACALFT